MSLHVYCEDVISNFSHFASFIIRFLVTYTHSYRYTNTSQWMTTPTTSSLPVTWPDVLPSLRHWLFPGQTVGNVVI